MMDLAKTLCAVWLVTLVPATARANLKVADTSANLGITFSEKTPKAVLEVVGNSNGNGTALPSFQVKGGAAGSPLLTVSDDGATPTVSVGGSLQVGNSAPTCDSGAAGTMRFDASEGGLRICDGTDWVGTTPPGAVIASAVDGCPAGWLLSDGAEHDQAQYPALFTAIGTTYDPDATAGEGFFRVPDYRGYFLRGVDASGTVDPASGRTLGSIQSDDVGPHTHTLSILNTLVRDPESGVTTKRRGNLMTTGSASSSNPETSAGLARLETRPKNVAVHYCIKY